MKKTKTKILEIIILITIIISLIVILLFAKDILSKKPEISNSNEIQNYSKTRIIKYTSNIVDSYFYEIPYQELINVDASSYTKYLTATDNIINTFTEKIIIRYTYLQSEEETIIKNYCNTYDAIELEYKFQCTYSKNVLLLSNQYYINKINTDIITNKHKVQITIPIKKNTRLNEYIENLNKNMIPTTEVDEIK